MNGALDARRTTRRDDSGARAARRPEPTRPRESAARETSASSRRAGHSEKAASAKKADRAEDRDDTKTVERDDDATSPGTAAADQSETPRAEAKTGGDAAEPSTNAAADTASGEAAQAAAEETPGAAASALLADDAAADADADSLARGRRWATPAAEGAEEQGETATKVTGHRAAGAGAPGLKVGHAIQQARTNGAATPGEAFGQIAQDIVAAAHTDAAAGAAGTGAPITKATETAAGKPQAASAADAATAIENAVSAVETIATAEAVADSGTGGSDTPDQSQQQKPHAPAQANVNEAVAVGGPSEGTRFTVNGAAGNAAYASAAPRQEEAVLPQIVQSIRLHAVQGTTEARVQLRPDHLGALNITLRVEQNQVTATIQADVAAVRQWIEANEASLRQALSEQGLQLTKLVVHSDDQQASKDEQDGERPRRQPRRRSWRDEEATFEVLV